MVYRWLADPVAFKGQLEFKMTTNNIRELTRHARTGLDIYMYMYNVIEYLEET